MFHDTFSIPGSEHSIDAHGLLTRTSRLDQCIRIITPEAFRKRIMYITHSSVHAGHPRLLPYVQYITQVVLLAQHSREFSRLCRPLPVVHTYKRKTVSIAAIAQALSRDRTPSFIALGLLGPLSMSETGHEHIIVITNRLTMLTRAILLKTTKSQVITDAFS